jgi:hypothetical protein
MLQNSECPTDRAVEKAILVLSTGLHMELGALLAFEKAIYPSSYKLPLYPVKLQIRRNLLIQLSW